MKKIVVSSALAAALMIPAMGVEVFSNDDAKVDVYGSLRGYIGGGADVTKASPSTGANYGTFLMGVQSNSRLGVKATMGKFTGNIELGAAEANGIKPGSTGLEPGFRQFWGSYDTGIGTILFGKTDTPSLASEFNYDWFNTDTGSNGFGGISTGNRKMQIQYKIAGLTVAVVEDNDNVAGGTTTYNNKAPRLSAAYKLDTEGLMLKVGGSYKYYSDNGTAPSGTSAYHVFAGVKPTFGNMFVSFLAHYGKNAHLYGEQQTSYSQGGYGHSKLDSFIGLDAQRAGATLAFGMNFTSELSMVIGGGYQATFGGAAQTGADKTIDGVVSSYQGFFQLPYKVSKNFTFVPQVSYYETSAGTEHLKGVIAATRLKFDF